jgi:hypothetical protein
MGNILGEPFKEYVNKQINKRQEIHGKKLERTIDEIQYLNSRNAWVKLASGVSIDQSRLDYLNKTNNPLLTDITTGKKLSRSYVLFNGLTGYDSAPSVNSNGIPFPNDQNITRQSARAGIGSNGAYGVGGTDFGYSPMPGIIDAELRCINKGSIKKATVNVKVHNKYQFDIIDTLYLRVGFSVMLEWGYNKYYHSETGLTNMNSSLIDSEFWQDRYDKTDYSKWLPLIEEKRKQTEGNYDGIFGVVSNFSWTFNSDGSYDVKIEIISLGDVIESLKVNLPPLGDGAPSAYLSNNQQALADKFASQEINSLDIDTFYTTVYPDLEKDLQDYWSNEQSNSKSTFTSFVYTKSPQDIYTVRDAIIPTPVPNGITLRSIRAALGVIFQGKEFYNIYGDFETNNPSIQKFTRSKFESFGRGFDDLQQIVDLDNNPIPNDKNGLIKYFKIENNLAAQSVLKDTYTNKELIQAFYLAKQSLGTQLTDSQFSTLIFKNIPFETFKKAIYDAYTWYEQDDLRKTINSFDKTPDVAAEEGSAPPVETFNEILEKNKNKNRIYKYLYNIRVGYENAEENPLINLLNNAEAINYNKGNISNTLQNYTRGAGNSLNPINTSVEQWNKIVGYPLYSDTNTSKDIIRLFIEDPSYSYFMRLGTLLDFINDQIIPKITSDTELGKPIITIDTNVESNICYVIDNMISNDITKCIINNNSFFNGSDYDQIYNGLEPFIQSNDSALWGNLMNVYINFNHILQIFDKVDERNEIKLYDILSDLCQTINQSLGNVNNLEPVVEEETNIIKIVEQSPIPLIDTIKKQITEYQSQNITPAQIQLYGYKNNTSVSTFVRDVGLTTEISKNYATMITIGATANGSIPGAESTAFSKWNIGLEDRFKNNIIDAVATTSSIDTQNLEVINNYKEFIQSTNLKLGLTEGLSTINQDVIATNTTVIENFYKYAQTKQSQKSNSVESSVGFLPFNLKLTIDGIGGIKIYNSINVNTDFLPSNYPDSLQFIITGVNHKLSNNDWVTSLETIATSKGAIGSDTEEAPVLNTAKILGAVSPDIQLQRRIRQNKANRNLISQCSVEDEKVELSSKFKLPQLSCAAYYAHSIPQVGESPKKVLTYEDKSKTKLIKTESFTRQDIIDNLTAVARYILEPILFNYPTMVLTNGYRNNKDSSQHEKGQAVDIQFTNIRKLPIAEQNNKMVAIAENIKILLGKNYDQFLLEYKTTGTKQPWLHISYNLKNNRNDFRTFLNDETAEGGKSKFFNPLK